MIGRLLKKLTASLLIGTLVFGLCSCKSKTNDNGVDENGYGGTVTVGITQEPGTFDPHVVVAAGDEEILYNIFEGLFKYDSTGTLQPCLATDYSVSTDATQYTFTIREGVKFHNGDDMTLDDVKYSLDRAAGLLEDSEGALVAELDSVESVEIVDGKIVVTLELSDSEILTYFTTAIVPSGVEDLNATPIGTGPFVFESYTVGQNVTLTRNDNYWQSSLPYLDSVVFKICADMDSGFLELQNGTIDIFPHVTLDKAEQLAEESFNTLSCASNMVQIFALNNEFGPLADSRVREAINYAIDRTELIELTMGGAGVPLTSGMSPAMGDSYDTSIDNTYSYDLERATELLADAGCEDGFDLTITVPSEYLVHVNTAIAIADQLSAVGINVEIQQVDWATWLSDVYTDRNYEATVICLTSNYSAYDVMSRYASDNAGNFINYSNQDYDELIAQIPLTTDLSQRNEYYHQLLGYMVTDNASCYIQDPMEITVVASDLTGYNVFPMYVQDMSSVHYVVD